MSPSPHTVDDVVRLHLCCGCGACRYASPGGITMADDVDLGRRPVVVDAARAWADGAAAVCPGRGLSHDRSSGTWGPVLEVWEGHAADAQIRWSGSSGGAATALALQCLQHEGMYGVLHTAARSDAPLLNQSVLSTTREHLLAATGSRYSPASPCDGLDLVEAAPAPCVFIGKPCDVAAVAKARESRPALDRRIGLTVAIFCAGTPSTAGTLRMLQAMGVSDPHEVTAVRYRGEGWPGEATVVLRDGSERRMPYEESWGILQRHRQWRCHVCPDHTGEFADVAVGDPWYREIEPMAAGSSLIVARTERGRALVRRAIELGLLEAVPVDPSVLDASQPNLRRTRGAVWGRLLACRIVGVGVPTYRRMPMFPTWRTLGWRAQLQSVCGTLLRIHRRRLRDPEIVVPAATPVPFPGRRSRPPSPISVIIPAHDAEKTIGQTLDALLSGAVPGELDIIVVCNGCRDGTVAIARGFEPRITVVVLERAGKAAAMNVGDEIAEHPWRVYLDADVRVDVATIRALRRALDRPGVTAAAPSLHIDASGSSWPVRAYVAVWQRLPGIRDGLSGRGVFALSPSGHEQLGSFPEDLVNDDGFVDALLVDASVGVPGFHSIVGAPATTRELLRRRRRVHYGNRQLDARTDGVVRRSHGVTDVVRLCRGQPTMAPAALVFMVVTAAARLGAAARWRAGRPPRWGSSTP